MLKNYLKIAFRNLIKNKFYTFINVMGLAVGMCCCLLIFFWVQGELSFDLHHTKIDRLYRLSGDVALGNSSWNSADIPFPITDAIKEEIPEVEEVVRLQKKPNTILEFEASSFKVENAAYADSSLFDVFTIPLIQGNPETALTTPGSMVIDEELAGKIFGRENPIGKMLKADQGKTFMVSGVFKKIPENSHFHFDAFFALSGLGEQLNTHWLYFAYNSYVVLRKGTNAEVLEKKMLDISKNHLTSVWAQLGQSWDDMVKSGNKIEFSLQPVRDIHLYSDLMGEPNGNILNVYIFSAIAILILLIACINFINLSTARSSKRAKEVGVRKVLGALRPQLIRQFLAEAFLLTLLAMIVAIPLLEISLPIFNDLASKQINPEYWDNLGLWVILITIFLLTAALSGSFPAFYLSSLDPSIVLKGNLGKEIKKGNLRNGLVILQFAVSIFLIAGSIVIYNQLDFLKNTNPGFNKDQLIVLNDTQLLGSQTETFKQELLKKSVFKSATISSSFPTAPPKDKRDYNAEDQNYGQSITMENWKVDYDYFETIGVQLKEGRFFSNKFPSDSSAVLINEAAAKKFGYPQPVGKNIISGVGTFSIIGVVKDFNYQSMRNKVAPLVFFLGRSPENITFRFEPQQSALAIKTLKESWNKFATGKPFSYNFLDQQFNDLYQQEEQNGKIMSVFSALAIFIACLGLFGLAAFTAEQRKKEIGVRKVLGASIKGIVMLLSKEFTKLLLMAFVIACPLAWWVMDDWLQGFAYRTSMSMGVFLLAGLISFVVAWITMSYHAIKAATNDPVNAIRYE
ncbi:ABC transporter permease [Xanthovirga aplysinae]|uniref:ABC transporter permease n=1 Tax=Xanthovirga aplysinae TaxID=2529853 RepID=UPI0012BBD0FE|nr:ABC transporter permease [Xanthovirga aplysinae]MTI31228.1 ABC transporter permease [Xanthovirga aplysinae]